MKQDLETKTRRSILLGRNGGQAVVEYILIVSIAVGLVFILKGAFKGMSTFIDNYLGSYTECLMAHGELPSLGVTDSDLKEHLSSSYKCDSGFKSFTLAEGRPPVDGGGSSNLAGRGANNKNGNNNDKNSNSSETAGGGSSKGSKNNRDKNSFGSGSGSGSGSNPYDEGQIRRRGRGTADGFAGGGNNRSRLIDAEGEGEDAEGAGGRGRRRPRQSRIIYRDNGRYRAVLGDQAEQILNKTERSTFKRKPTSRTVAQVEGGSAPGPRSGLMKQAPAKAVIVEETKEAGWGFGKMLKWLLIIGIVVAIVIFFGGQLLNYSNSDS